MATIQEALAQGWQAQRAGNLAVAEQIYRQVLDAQPDHAEALYLLGTVCHRLGRLDDAAQNLLMAVSLKPDYAEAHNNLGVVMIMMGRRLDAIQHFRHVVRLRPNDADAVNNLGNALREEGSLDEAARVLGHALRLRPEFPDALHNLGLTLHDQGKLDEAVARLREALRLRPEFVEVHSDLGLMLVKLKKWDEAETQFRRLIELRPERYDGHLHLGAVLRELGRLEESADRLRHAAGLKPDDATVRSSLGLTLQQLGRLSEAEDSLRQALKLDPKHADAHNNLAVTLVQLGRIDESITHYDRAIEAKPEQPIYRRNRALARLTAGDWEHAWADYEARWQCPGFEQRDRNYTAPPWRGEPLAGKSLLLYWEQGLGDTIQFVRFAPVLKRLGARQVMVEVQPALVRLISSAEAIDRVVTAGDQVPLLDFQAALGSVPGLLGTTVETVPAEVPYLHAEPERVGFWRSQLAGHAGLKIGVAWQGNPKQGGDRERSIPLTQFAPLARLPGVQLLSLQKGPGSEQVAEARAAVPVVDLARRLDLSGGAFLDTAAVMMNLDLIVTCDTSIAHLAGALGVPVWVALSAAPDWRWLRDREDSPWYPTVRLFRQTKPGRWDDVFERIAGELRQFLARPNPRAIPVEVSPGELIDKVTILQIKTERIQDPDKLHNVRAELAALTGVCDETLPPSEEVSELAAELKEVNERIWEAEDELRRREREQRFDHGFIEAARTVYRTNDRRAAIKRRINEIYAAQYVEEKEHPAY